MSIENTVDQCVHLVNRSSLELTGICDVSAFTECVIEAEYGGGCIAIEGSELKIVDFSSQTGMLKICGTVNSIYYYGSAKKHKRNIFHR